MPIYQWRCEKCGHVHERIQKIDEKQQPDACEQCGEAAMKQIITAAKINKGPGWGGGKGNW